MSSPEDEIICNRVEKAGVASQERSADFEGIEHSSLDIHEYLNSIYSGSLVPDRHLVMWAGKESPSPESDPDAFMDGLIDFVKQKAEETSPTSKESLAEFLHEINDTYFSYSPNILNRCSLGGLLRLGAKANRVPQIQGCFGQAAVGEITYTLAFVDESGFDRVERSLKGLPISEELDVINFLQTVAADAVANGSWSRPALKRIEALLGKMQVESESPFLDYALNLSLKRINAEKNDPTLSFVTFQGNNENGRLSEALQGDRAQESDRYGRSFRSSIPLERGDKYLRISQDAIAIIDRANAPKYYGKIREDELGTEAKIDMRAIERLKQVANDRRNLSKLNLSRVLDYVNHNIMGAALGADIESPQEVGGLWASRVGIFTAEKWTEFFSSKQRVDGAKYELQRFEYQQQKDAEGKNEMASNEFVRKIYGTVKVLVESGAEPPRGWDNLKSLVEKEDFGDESFDAAETILAPFRYEDWMGDRKMGGIYALPELRALAVEWKGLQDRHQKNFQEVQEEVEEKYAREEEGRLEVVIRYNQLLDSLAAKAVALQRGLIAFAEELENEMASDLPQVRFEPYGALISDKNVNPFPGKDQPDLPLLMQQLHRPQMRQQIEDDLGVSFDEFNLNSQVHLLQFLAGNNKETFSRIQKLLQHDLPYKKEFLISFLSSAGDYAFGEKLVDIAERYSPKDAEKIFAKYSELVTSAEGSRTYLQETYGEELATNPALEDAIIQNLLKRGKDLLLRAAQEGDNESTVLDELEHNKGDLLLFANAFKGMYGPKASLDQFKELGIEHVPGGKLSEDTLNKTGEYEQMLLIADRNWDDLRKIMPHMYEKIMQDVSTQLKGLDPKTGEAFDTMWHVMKRGDIVLGYFRLDTTAPDTVYFGSMNSLPDLHGFRIGEAILSDMLANETDGKLTEAHASPKTAICRSYINKHGFVGTGLLSYYKTGEQLLAIDKDRRPEHISTYQLQGKTFAELEASTGPDGVEVLEYMLPEDFRGEEYERFLEDAQERFDRGMVLSAYVADTTAYATNPATSKKVVRYLAGFEPKKQESVTESPSPR